MAANPNTISAGIQETWDKVYQATHHQKPVYPAISNFRLASQLKVGDTVHRQYRNTLVANDMGGDGSYERQAITDTDESLVISYEKEAAFYIKELDEIQNHLPTRERHAYDAMVALFNQVDADVLGQYSSFNNSLDDGDLGGTSGNGITVSTSNITKLFTRSLKKIQRANLLIDNTAKFSGFRLEDSMKQMAVAVISPDVYSVLLEYLEGKDTALGDKVGVNGHAGRWMNFDLFISNAVAWSGELALATNPTDGDTIVINGVTFTFKATIGSTAGNVHICSSADATRANLENALNAPTTSIAEATDTGFVGFTALGTEDKALRNLTATDNATTNILSLVMLGRGYVEVSETLTDGTDTFTAAKQMQHCLFGIANSIDVVIQKQPGMKMKDRDGKVGMDVVSWTVYGIKVFNESKDKMVDVKVRTDAY